MRKLLTVGAVSLAMTLPMAAHAKKGKQLKNFLAISYNAQVEVEQSETGSPSEDSDEGMGFRVDAQYFVSNSIALIARFSEDEVEYDDTNVDVTIQRIEVGGRAYMPIGQQSNAFFGVTYEQLETDDDTNDIEATSVAAQIGASSLVTPNVKVWGVVKIGRSIDEDSNAGAETLEYEVGGSYRFYKQYSAHVMYSALNVEADDGMIKDEVDINVISVGVSYLF